MDKTWCTPSVRMLGELYKTDLSIAEMAEQLRTRFGRAFNRNAILGKAHRLGLCEERRSDWAPPPPLPPRLPRTMEDRIATLAQKASSLRHGYPGLSAEEAHNEAARIECGLHLLDLKRAGFTARHGELDVSPGEFQPTVTPYRKPDRSWTGSTAAMCAIA